MIRQEHAGGDRTYIKIPAAFTARRMRPIAITILVQLMVIVSGMAASLWRLGYHSPAMAVGSLSSSEGR